MDQGAVFRDLIRAWRAFHRPAIEPQMEPAECGYVCISALLAILGRPTRVRAIKDAVGHTGRGMTLRQVRDALTALEVPAEAVAFDARSPSAYPVPGILLFERGHYIVARRVRDRKIEIFDPGVGWAWYPLRQIARQANGLAVRPCDPTQRLPAAPKPAQRPDRLAFLGHYVSRLGAGAFVCTMVAQAGLLALPLISKASIDSWTGQPSHATPLVIALAFIGATSLGAGVNFASATLDRLVQRRAIVSFGGAIFDNFAVKPPSWFDAVRPATLQAKISAVENRLGFTGEMIRAIGMASVSLVVGGVVLFQISPWLAVPGLIGLAVSILVELSFNRIQSSHLAASFEAVRARQSFNLEILTRLPMLARFGALGRGRARYGVAVARTAAVESELQSIRHMRGALIGFVKSAEILVFVTVTALFLTRGEQSLGAFVAVAAYKDLLSQGLSSLFQLRQRHHAMEVERLFTEDFDPSLKLTTPVERDILRGEVELDRVGFRYGALDVPVLEQVSFKLDAGECLIIRGESGSGKSTLAKLICGLATPSEGRVLIDGRPPTHPMRGFGAVLQSDVLLPGSIRDNITMFRRGVRDDAIWAALELVELSDFVAGLPMRLSTTVGEGMAGLSGGQKQRLLLARAVLIEPKLLLLDEATASLDVETERAILHKLKDRGATLILISHRPEVWTMGDRFVEHREGQFLPVNGVTADVSRTSLRVAS